MYSRFLLAVCSLLPLVAATPALRAGDDFEARMFKSGNNQLLPYRLLKPLAYDPHQKYPIILFLHGAGERGNDNQLQTNHVRFLAAEAIRRKYPCFVLAPQCPWDQRWVNVSWRGVTHRQPEIPSPWLAMALQVEAGLEKEFSIDPDRRYVMGLSMGGFGVWDAISRHPQMFAAAVPICGGGDETRAESIAKVPVWVFHGGQDSVVQTACSRNMVAALKNAGGTPKYTEYPGVGHDSWTHAFKEPELLPWLFAQKRRGGASELSADVSLRMDFVAPPDAAKPWCYWWWLNGAASKEGITRDFQEMKRQGIAGALLFDAGEAGPDAPRGPNFMSPPWREFYKHAVREANRLGIALSVNLCSGWNAGGPWVTPQHAAKKLVAATTVVKGPGHVSVSLPQPEKAGGFYRDIAVLARPVAEGRLPQPKPSAGSADVWQRSRTVDLTQFVDGQGRLAWDAPAGTWDVLRVGCTLHGNLIKCVGSGPAGLEIDTMSSAAMDLHFAETGAKLIADAGPLVGKTLQYFHIDSWELGQPTWTPAMREEFRRRRGYDPLLFLPALLERTVDDPPTTQRFLADYRRTAADLVAANYYGRFRDLTLKGGLRGTHPESGGPFFTHWIDGLECEGINDIPMGEFWKRNSEPGGPITNDHNPSLKQAASAAHVYGKRDCQAEAFTSFGCDWIDDPWTMKDIGDAAFCEGLTRNVLCFWVHQSRLDAKPGFQWAHVGTHFDSNLTWWPMSGAWLTYLARCQHLLRQGLFVADFAYLQEEAIPGFIDPRKTQRPALPAGFDYDALNAEVLLSLAVASDGRLTLPDGMSYRYLVLPHRAGWAVSPALLRRILFLAERGVTVIGSQPDRAPGLSGFPHCDEEIKTLAARIWGPSPAADGQRLLGKGRILWGRDLAAIARSDGLLPDIEFGPSSPPARLDWIHRHWGDWEIFFLSNQASTSSACDVAFRVQGKQPELWDAVTGQIRPLPQFRLENGRTTLPLVFAPRQSFFVVFHQPAAAPGHGVNFPTVGTVAKIEGPWQVSFDPKWGGPGKAAFATLEDWTQRPEDGIRYYSGTAVYRQRFKVPPSVIGQRLYLDLGAVKNVARVTLNNQDLGAIWTAPWRVDVTEAVRPNGNNLEIEVANLWPNRLIGDGLLPREKRLTQTNVKTYDTPLPPITQYHTYGCLVCYGRLKSDKPPPLLPSGLLGPVTLQAAKGE
jgi:poly(3-hydroxybutyrate) depolymerase